MTDSAGQPNDIDARLEVLGDEIDLLRTELSAVRVETRANSQTIAQLERSIAELGNIARLHQQALRISQQNIDRIWSYLESQIGGNGSSPTN